MWFSKFERFDWFNLFARLYEREKNRGGQYIWVKKARRATSGKKNTNIVVATIYIKDYRNFSWNLTEYHYIR